jgi:hypothetical protein
MKIGKAPMHCTIDPDFRSGVEMPIISSYFSKEKGVPMPVVDGKNLENF